jgi:hypothetical protein
MILSRVLPQIHFSLYDGSDRKQKKLEEEVEIMLKASICNLGVELNSTVSSEISYNCAIDEYINQYQQLYLNNCL